MPPESPILQHLEEISSGNPSPEALAWLKAGIRGYLDGAPLPEALGLNGLHSRGARYALLYSRARRHLRNAADLLPPGGTPWITACLLTREIKAFDRFRWPKLRGRAEPPECLSRLDRELFGAFRALDGKVPQSSTRLFEIIAAS